MLVFFCERHNFSFTNPEFHTVSLAPASHNINILVRLADCNLRKVNGTIGIYITSKKQIPIIINWIAEVINKHIED
jgi:hypothetical protein